MNRQFNAFLSTVGGNEGSKCKYPQRLDTYGRGCQHDCKYCYAKSLLSFRKMWDNVNPAVANFSDIWKVARKSLRPFEIVRLGGMTDCFQPLELERRATYNTISELNQRNIGYLIVTKSDIVARDEYIDLMRKGLAHIQITVTSTDDAFCGTYEHATAPSRRIKAIEKLQKAGFDVQLRLSPFIPQFISEGVLDMGVINNISCSKAIVEFLRVNSWIRKWFDIDYSEYTLSEGGYRHMDLNRKLKYISGVTGFDEVSVCEDVTSHYEYWRDNFNPNKEDCCNLKKLRI